MISKNFIFDQVEFKKTHISSIDFTMIFLVYLILDWEFRQGVLSPL